MKTAQYYVAYVNRKLWQVAAVLLVTLAVAISVLRYSLPYMDSQKHRMEEWLLQEYGVVLEIGYISAAWKGKGPVILLKDLTLERNELSPIAFTVDETQIELDFWSSLQAWQIHSPRFNLVGMEMDVDLPTIQNSGDGFPIIDALQTLFLDQLQRFSVSNSSVLVKTLEDEQRIQIQELSWLNEGERHQGIGDMKVVELARNSARFVLDLTGSKNDLRGTFYAEAQDLDLSPWLKQFIETDYSLEKSRGNFQLWADLRNSQIVSVQAKLQESRFAWQAQQSDEVINASILQGQFSAQPVLDDNNQKQWRFLFEDLQLAVNDRLLETSWSGFTDHLGVLTLNSDKSIYLEPLLPLTGVLLGESAAELVNKLKPQVEVSQFQLLASREQLGAKLVFEDLRLAQIGQVPGVSGMSGQLSVLGKQLKLQLAASNGELDSENLLGRKLPFDEIRAAVHLDLAQGTQVRVEELKLLSDDLNLDQAVFYDVERRWLSATGQVQSTQLTKLKKLFPVTLMGQGTRNYLNRALVDGEMQRAQLLWHGELAAFPFVENQGTFQAKVDIKDSRFLFDPRWPELSDMDATLLFENMSLSLVSPGANIMGVKVSELSGYLPELKVNSTLTLNGFAQGSGTDITQLMQASSLAKTVGKALDAVVIEDTVTADVQIDVPLVGTNIVAQGVVQLNQNPIWVKALNLDLAQVSGALEFRNEQIKGIDLASVLLGQPISWSVTGEQGTDAYHANVDIRADWQIEPLLMEYHEGLIPYFSGGSEWQAHLGLNFPRDGFDYSLQIITNLQSLSSELPAPLAKAAPDSMRLIVDTEGDLQVSSVRMLLGNDVKFNGIFPHKDLQFSRAHLSVGEDNFVGMGLGFSVSADLERFNFSDWYQAIEALTGGAKKREKSILAAPQRIYLEADVLEIAGQDIQQLELLAKQNNDDWTLDINTEEARAKVNMSKDWNREGIRVAADYINLPQWQQVKEPESDKSGLLGRLPPLEFSCKQCRIGKYDLGQLDFQLARSGTGMRIEKLNMQTPNGTLTASGNWYEGHESDSTRLEGSFTSKDFGAYLKSMHVNSGIRDSDATMQFDLSWKNAPHEFNFASLNGDLDWRLGDGYLAEVSDQGARIFSILSLESLVRKLSLDFRDVFAKGFFYQDMKGSFVIANGKASTDDTKVNGAAAGIDILGYTDLTNNQLNYQVSVSPKLTSSIPVLVAWMVNPATALAAFALDEVISSANVVSKLNYTLTGTLQEPIITEVKRSSRVVEMPAQRSLEPATESEPVETTPEALYPTDISLPTGDADTPPTGG